MNLWKIAAGVLAAVVVFVAGREVARAASSSAPGAGRLDTSGGKPPSKWTAADYRELHALSARLGVSSPDVLAVLRNESGLDPQAEFPGGLARGLNQLTDAGRSAIGMSESEFDSYPGWSVAQQLPVVERSLRAAFQGARPQTAGAIYAFNFLPARARARGTAPATVLGTVEEFPKNEPLADSAGNYTPAALSARLRRFGDRRKDGSPVDPLYLGALQALRDAVGDQSLSPTW